jgi:peptidoglycan/LPS O-acetylase OafA/YrhL
METGRRVNEIDLLRFLAALAVVFHHYAFRGHAADNLTVLWYSALVPVAKYGYLGVDLFFMISGFVIFMTVSDGTLRHFVVSRVAKLYPAFWICCTITFVVSLAIGGERFPVSVIEYLVNMLCLGGVFGVAAIDGLTGLSTLRCGSTRSWRSCSCSARSSGLSCFFGHGWRHPLWQFNSTFTY